jgi:protein SCO1/2
VGLSTHAQKPTRFGGGLPLSKYWLLLLALPVLGALAFAIFQPIQVLPRIALAPGFSFTDQNGARLTSDDLRGKLVYYTFMYTGCDANCAQTVQGLKAIQQAVDEAGSSVPVEFVAISFDPQRDTPERLSQFATEHGLAGERWHFVTGDPAQLKNVIGAGFGAYYDQTDDGAFRFDPMYVLVDGWGIQRAFYRTPMPDPARIVRDINFITKELENSEGLNRLAYEAAHLFLCYPD